MSAITKTMLPIPVILATQHAKFAFLAQLTAFHVNLASFIATIHALQAVDLLNL